MAMWVKLALSMVLGVSAVSAHEPVLDRDRFNRYAVRENLPVYWSSDIDRDALPDLDELLVLRFYPESQQFADNFATEAPAAIARIRRAIGAGESTDLRLQTLARELDQARPIAVVSDFASVDAAERAFVQQMLKVADLIDALYHQQLGVDALRDQLPADALSRSVYRRNHGPLCVAPATQADPNCHALETATKPEVSVYPSGSPAQKGQCDGWLNHAEADALRDPFTVVRADASGALEAVPYAKAWPKEMAAISAELNAAASLLDPKGEAALVRYLKAAATAFLDNNWQPADEAWAAMNADNSRWYVRVGPDEVYWEPCALKAGMHLTFASINPGSRAWQAKLAPWIASMEHEVAKAAGRPYTARKVRFDLPDFIDIVVNAGDDRDPIGATIGQSLPNWGPVAEQSRGRTVAMVNLYTDPDSLQSRIAQARSLVTANSIAGFGADTTPSLLTTILHEATHNLGPTSQHRVDGKADSVWFGGPLAAILEELKCEAGANHLLGLLEEKQVIDPSMQRQAHAATLLWSFAQVSEGMFESDGTPKTYPQVAAIRLGFFMDEGAIKFRPRARSADGHERGAFEIDPRKLAGAAHKLLREVAGIKARADRAAAQRLIDRYVMGDRVPMALIAERMRRFPAANFVYAVRW